MGIEVLNFETNANKTANMIQNVRTHRKKVKPPDSGIEAARQRSDSPNGIGDHTDGPRY